MKEEDKDYIMNIVYYYTSSICNQIFFYVLAITGLITLFFSSIMYELSHDPYWIIGIVVGSIIMLLSYPLHSLLDKKLDKEMEE